MVMVIDGMMVIDGGGDWWYDGDGDWWYDGV